MNTDPCCGTCAVWKKFDNEVHWGRCSYEPMPFSTSVHDTRDDEGSSCACHTPRKTRKTRKEKVK